MSRRSQYPKGLHDINIALKDAGFPQFRLCREGGRFHFNGPKTDKWPEVSVNVKRLEQLSVKEWMDAFNELKEAGDTAVEMWNDPAYQPGHSVELGYAMRGQKKNDKEKPMAEMRYPNAQKRIDEQLSEVDVNRRMGTVTIIPFQYVQNVLDVKPPQPKEGDVVWMLKGYEKASPNKMFVEMLHPKLDRIVVDRANLKKVGRGIDLPIVSDAPGVRRGSEAWDTARNYINA